MVKQLVTCIFIVKGALLLADAPKPSLDWLDEISAFVHKKCLLVFMNLMVQKLDRFFKSILSMIRMKLKNWTLAAANHKESGLGAAVHGASYTVQITAAKSQLKYHEKVATRLKELPENKRDRESLGKNLGALKEAREEIEELKKELGKAAGILEKSKILAKIATKEGWVAMKKTYIKALV